MQSILSCQCTIGKEISFQGVGLHTGKTIWVRLKPAPADHGIRFHRVDLPGSPGVPARYDHVVDTSLATVLGRDGVKVGTVEHFMAAIGVEGIDNLRIELDGPEMPILDGSAEPYLRWFGRAGIQPLDKPRQCIRLEKPLMVEQEGTYVKASPSACFEVVYTIDFGHPTIGRQCFSWVLEDGSFARDVARARTFGFLKDVEALQRMGLARGGSLENAVVFDDRGVINPEGLRFEDECVRHKILDFLGDLALSPRPVLARFEVHKGGHRLHNLFLRRLMDARSCWSVVRPMAVMPGIPLSGRQAPPWFPAIPWDRVARFT